MQTKFIKEVLKYVLSFEDLSDLILVLPSARLGRYIEDLLLKEFKKKAKPSYMPKFISLNDLLFRLSKYGKANDLELQLILYKSYVNIYSKIGKKAEVKPYMEFIEWAKMLIGDFNLLDSQNADVKVALTYSAEEKRIANLNFDLGENSNLKSKYLNFYANLWDIYQEFTENIKKEGIVYKGLASRGACDNISDAILNKHYVFAGFNALTKTEEYLIRYLIKEGKAEIFWDADAYYIEDKKQEAGYFLRYYAEDEFLGKNLSLEHISTNLLTQKKKIYIAETPQTVGMLKMAGEFIKDLQEKNDTIVVLNDESLLLPMMNSLPEGVDCNVAIGSKLSGTYAHSLINTLLNANLDFTKENVVNANLKFKLTYIIQLFENRVFAHVLSLEKEVLRKIIDDLYKFTSLELSKDDLFDLLELKTNLSKRFIDSTLSFTSTVFKNPSDCFMQLDNILTLISISNSDDKQQGVFIQEDLFQSKNSKLNAYEIEYINQLSKLLCEHIVILDKYAAGTNIEAFSLRKIILDIANSIQITYKGAPDADIHITGMLETLGMAYRNVIMLSVNEGVMPSATNDNSFLLHSVRKHFKIPLDREKTAMQAYYFYRLLQNAENVYLLSTSSDLDRKAAEKSRFILQLENELPQFICEAIPYKFNMQTPIDEELITEIPKTKKGIEKIRQILGFSGISPSLLSIYMYCPAKFYMHYILRLKPQKEIEEDIQANTKGSIAHLVLEKFFSGISATELKIFLDKYRDENFGIAGLKPSADIEDSEFVKSAISDLSNSRVGRVLDRKDYAHLKAYSKLLVGYAFMKELPMCNYKSGKNFLAYNEVLLYISNYLSVFNAELGSPQMNMPRIIVEKCEKKLSFNAYIEKHNLNIKIGGIVDRIDDINGEIRIVDYKTGRVELNDLKVNNIDEIYAAKKEKALQLLMYRYVHYKHSGQLADVSCIYALKTKKESALELGGEYMEDDKLCIMKDVETLIEEVVDEMLDEGIGFEKRGLKGGGFKPLCDFTEENTGETCIYCDYADFCKESSVNFC